MMTVVSTTSAGEAQGSLRERKKLATRRSLRRVTLDLVAERGFSRVTVEEIAEAAEVSPRTFFNYFASKEAALFGSYQSRDAAVRERIAREAPGEPALDVLRTVLASEARAVAEEYRELGGDPVQWLSRMREARTDPQLRAAHAAQMAMVERGIAEALAERFGTDLDCDPYPGLLAAMATAVFRSSMSFWSASGGRVALDQIVDLEFRAVADGLPESCDLRHVTGHVADRKDNR